MAVVTQVEPVTNLQRGYAELFGKTDAGPVILTNRGKAAAVLLSVREFDRMASQLEEKRFTQRQVEAILLAYRQRDAGDGDAEASDELRQRLIERYGRDVLES